jgi:hypothetical protein
LTRGQEGDDDDGGDDEDDGLYMRDVGRRSKTAVEELDGEGEKEAKEDQKAVVKKKPVVISRKEAKRLGLTELH